MAERHHRSHHGVREYSLERLPRLLTRLGRDIDMVIRPARSDEGRWLRIAAS